MGDQLNIFSPNPMKAGVGSELSLSESELSDVARDSTHKSTASKFFTDPWERPGIPALDLKRMKVVGAFIISIMDPKDKTSPNCDVLDR